MQAILSERFQQLPSPLIRWSQNTSVHRSAINTRYVILTCIRYIKSTIASAEVQWQFECEGCKILDQHFNINYPTHSVSSGSYTHNIFLGNILGNILGRERSWKSPSPCHRPSKIEFKPTFPRTPLQKTPTFLDPTTPQRSFIFMKLVGTRKLGQFDGCKTTAVRYYSRLSEKTMHSGEKVGALVKYMYKLYTSIASQAYARRRSFLPYSYTFHHSSKQNNKGVKAVSQPSNHPRSQSQTQSTIIKNRSQSKPDL